MADAQSVILPYVLVAIVLAVLAVVIARFPLPAMGNATQRHNKEERKKHSLWNHRNLVFGIPAIFIYLIGLHILGAFKHTFFDRNGGIFRMLPFGKVSG